MDSVVNDQDLFNKAAAYVQTKAASMSADNLLYLYARYKQSQEGNCQTEAPPFWNINAKKKHSAWKSVMGMSRDQAEEEYVNKVSSLFPEWETEAAGIGSQGIRLTNSVSRPLIEDPIANKKVKTVFDWCQLGDTQKVRECLLQHQNRVTADCRDADGDIGLIHYAADRNDVDMIDLLAKEFNCDINAQDAEGLTALHYAVCCEHLEAISKLLSLGARKDIPDNEGVKVRDIVERSKELQDALQ